MKLYPRIAAAFVLLYVSVACSEGPIAPSGKGEKWTCCDPGPINIDIPLLINAENVMSGDTVTIRTVTTRSDGKSTWQLTGPAVFVIGSDSAKSISTPTATVTVRGSGSGVVLITARTASETATAEFRVATPSEVALRIGTEKELTMRLGDQRWISVQLIDDAGRSYRGVLGWASTNTNTVIVREEGAYFTGRFIQGIASGKANVIVSYHVLRDTSRVEVVPP